jgi:hypothetical protein
MRSFLSAFRERFSAGRAHLLARTAASCYESAKDVNVHPERQAG